MHVDHRKLERQHGRDILAPSENVTKPRGVCRALSKDSSISQYTAIESVDITKAYEQTFEKS